MPKRKSENSEYEKLSKKIRKLEDKLRRRRRHRRRSNSSSRSSHSPERDFQDEHVIHGTDHEVTDNNNVIELLDGGTELGVCAESQESTIQCTAVPVTNDEPPAVPFDNSAAVPNDNIVQVDLCVEPECADESVNSSLLEILGDDPTISNTYGGEIHKELAVRLEHFTTNGLTKELRKELIERYLVPSNCKLISAPALNAEIKAAVTDISTKRDKSIEQRQKQMSTVISCLSQATNTLICNKNADPGLTKMLMDSLRILCDLQYNDSVVRRNFILSSLNKEMRDQLQTTKPDSLLFGQNLSETIKTAKAINKSGADLKTQAPKPQANTKRTTAVASTSKNLNWKGPNVARKQPNHPKTKGPTANNRQSSSSSRSRRQPSTRSRR